MQSVRSRARFVAAIALAWHVVVFAAVATAFSCDGGLEHAGMKECPLHRSTPVCPLHGDKHGTHDCDCPTIGCSQTDAGFMAVFGAVGILPAAAELPIHLDSGNAPSGVSSTVTHLTPAPLSPPPRA
jgi:hypothetical protein